MASSGIVTAGSSSSSSSSSRGPLLDFEELLSREFRPADVVCLQPREKFHPLDPNEAAKKKKLKNRSDKGAIRGSANGSGTRGSGGKGKEEEEEGDDEEADFDRSFDCFLKRREAW